MNAHVKAVIGPRVPRSEWRARWLRYLRPTVLLASASVILMISVFTPYWHMSLAAPQYPKGLHVQAYLTHLEGDVQEIDGLNHYIGMRPLNEAAQLERSLSIMMVSVQAFLLLAAIFIHSRWAALLALPAVLFPVGFLLDLYFWMNHFGQNLDPTAPLSSAIKPFTPPVLGRGYVGQFVTVATPDTGLILAVIASLLVLAGLWYHRAAYKPLLDSSNAAQSEQQAGLDSNRVSQ